MTKQINERIARRKKHIDVLKQMREIMLESENWESLTDWIDAVTAGGIALERLNMLEDAKEREK